MITLRSPLKKSLHLSLILAIVLSSPLRVFAWGDRAHQIIGTLAWMKLSETAKRRVKELLQSEVKDLENPLAEISTWADRRGETYPEERSWHFVAIPLAAGSYSKERDCANGNCIVVKLNEKKWLLQNNPNPRVRAEALKYVVHLVGDLYQPLHTTDNEDRGGNLVQVKFLGNTSNLHKVWDADMIERSNLNVVDYANKLYSLQVPKWNWIEDWANDSHRVAQQYVYAIPKDRELGTTYYRRNLPLLELQLATAAEKLAEILNLTLESSPQQTIKAAPTKAASKMKKQ